MEPKPEMKMERHSDIEKGRQKDKNRVPQRRDQRHIPFISHGCPPIRIVTGI